MLAAMSPIILDRPAAPRIWSAAACRRCLPARLAGTCCKREPRADSKRRRALGRDEAEGFGEKLVGAAAVGVFVRHRRDHDFVHAGALG
jgi:hypothetical protein